MIYVLVALTMLSPGFYSISYHGEYESYEDCLYNLRELENQYSDVSTSLSCLGYSDNPFADGKIY